MGFKEYSRNTKAMSDVAQGGTPVVDFPISVGQIDRSEIYYTSSGTAADQATVEADIKQFQLMFGGNTFATYYPENVIKLNNFYGRNFEPGYLIQYFAEEWRQNTQEAESTSFVPGLFVDPALRIELSDGAADPAITHFLFSEGIGSKGRQNVDLAPTSTAGRLGQMGFPGLLKHVEHNIRIYTQGDTENEYFFERGSDVIRGWHFEGAHITGIRMLVDNQERLKFDNLRALNRQLEENGFTPQANIWSIVPEALAGTAAAHFRRNHGDAPNEVKFMIKTSAATNVDLLVEQYEMPPLRSDVVGG